MRVFALLCFAVISASCGRIGFDLTAPSGGDGDGDSGTGGDSGQGGAGGTTGGLGGSSASGGSGGQAGEAGASGAAGNGGTAGDDELDGGIDGGGPPDPVDVCVLDSCASDFDRCPNDPEKTSPGICGCDVSDDANDDDDSMPDCIDLCAGMPDVLPNGACGCPAAAGDLDGDGVQNCMDWCPDDGDKTEPLVCGCDISEADDDQDGMPTCADPCSADPEKVVPGVCGCGVIESDLDTDGDDNPDCTDACSGVNDASYVPDDTCGAGYCNTTNTASSCTGGVETACMPGAALTSDDATCDLVDDDCDGVRDDEYPVIPSNCGVGACARAGTVSCVSGEVFDSCVAAEPAIADTTCDGADDDCDTSADEDFSPRPSTCGVGACASTGTVTCAGGVEQDSCAENAASATDATCDGIDDDCDGQNDEDYGPTTTTCGTGACSRGGVTSCVGGDELDSCVPGTGAANDASCDGVDQDCSGAADEDYVVTTTNCGTGLCAATGQRTCVNGSTQNSCMPSAPAANDASCNGIDNDCNGTNDEDYVVTATSCGVGSCSAAGQLTCVSGAPSNSCTPGTPAANDASCDGVDQDCNGLNDDDYVPTATSCGIGACMASGQLVCTAGAVMDTCSDGSAGVDNDCDGVDDDCDGPSDEHFVPQATSCGVGACAATGVRTCSMGMTQNSCTPGAPAANDASCNNVDNDCNGQRDEDYVVTATSCGVGACAAAGQNTCVTGSVVNTCTPGTPAANDASCDNVDNDCNGTRDEDYVVTATSCGVGACAASGQRTCVSGSVVNSCTPGTPAANDASCNNVDNDCNGQRDEDYVVNATSCGTGACAATGQNTCVTGSVVNSCMPGAPAANDTTCNNIDEDCNGTRDEDYVVTATSCGLGQCAANGQNTCSMGSVVNTCTPGAPRAGLDDPTYPGNGVDNNCNGAIDEDSVPPCTVPDGVYSTTGLHNVAVPAGCTNAVVRIWGGGGASGGGGGFWGSVTGGLGGPGGYATRTFTALTTSTSVQLRVGGGAAGCGPAGANVDTTYSGGAGSTSRAGNGTNGANNTNPQGGNGGVSSSGGDGGKGFRGGGGGGGGGGPAWNPFGQAGGGGAATFINVGGTLMLAGGGGGGGGAGSNITSAGEAGGVGGSGCSGVGAAPSTNGGGGGGGGRCDGTTNQAGTGRNPHVPAGVTLPANTATGGNTTANCSAGGAGYAIIDWQP